MNIKRKIKYNNQSTHDFLINGLKVRRVYGDGCSLPVILMGLFFGGLLIIGMMMDIPRIYEDMQIQLNAELIEAEVATKCQRSKHKGFNTIYVDCSLTIYYDDKTYQKNLFFIDFTTQDFSFKAIKHRDHPDLISVDLALKTIIGQWAFSLILGFVGGMVVIHAVVLATRRIKLVYFLWEINHGYGELALLCVSEREEDVKYFNRVKNKSIAMKYGAFTITQSAKCKYHPFYYFRDGQLYILIVQNKNTGNFLIVDTSLKRLKISEQQRSEVYDALNVATID